MDKNLQKPYGFANFMTPEIAQAAIEKLNDADPFNCGSPMYIAIHKSKFQRQQQANVQTDTKIYIRDLRVDLLEDELRDAFAQFGTIASLSLKTSWVGSEQKKFGMVDFTTKEDCQEAIDKGTTNPLIQALTTSPDQPAYIKQAQPKRVREQYHK